jgi:hypothetical protein
MSQNINLKELERKAWRSVFQDGLWDIYLGLLLLAMAITALLSDAGISETWQYGVYIGLIVLGMVILWTGKKFITVPRMGRVKFGPKRKAKLKVVRLLLAISVLVGVLVYLITLTTKGNPSGWLNMKFMFPAIWMVNVLVLFSLGAYFLDFKRLYLIGVMYALPVPVDMMLKEFAHLRLAFIAFGVPAAVILIMGLVVFVRFVRDYPPAAEETPPAERALRGRC